ncbi:hypothetical protein HMI54_002381, partial [Coelomomyces lativittatus]
MKSFSLSPKLGYLALHSSVLISATFKPQGQGIFTQKFQLSLNHGISSQQIVEMKACCTRPSLEIKPSSALWFPPTLIGMSSRRVIEVENTSLLPLIIELKIPSAYENLIITEPKSTLIHAHQSSTIELYFQPLKPISYLFKLPLYYKKTNSSIPPSKTVLTLAGEGRKGTLVPSKKRVILDSILLFTPLITTNNEILIINPSDCTVHYKLRIMEKRDHDWVENKSNLILLLNNVDWISPRSKKPIILKLLIKQPKTYEFKLEIMLLNPMKLKSSNDQDWNFFCLLTTIGVFPLLEIVHVTGNVSNSFELMQSFNIFKLNEVLKTQKCDEPIKCHFIPQKEGTMNAEIKWVVLNAGKTPLKWSLISQQANAIYNSNDIPESNSVIKINPRKGHLCAGESVLLNFTCDYNSVGHYEYPFELHVKCGTSSHGIYPLILSAVVLDRKESRLFHAGETFRFSPVYIGASKRVISYMRLYNLGSTNTTFHLDLNSLNM